MKFYRILILINIDKYCFYCIKLFHERNFIIFNCIKCFTNLLTGCILTSQKDNTPSCGDIQEQKKRKRGYSSGCSYIDHN